MRTRPRPPVPLLDDGWSIDLRPPEGALARGYLPLGFEASPEDAARAGIQLRSPVAAEGAAALERGAFVFSTFCVPCHGAGLEGDGAVTKKGVPPPPSLLEPHALEMADGQVWHIITHGQGNMAGYASQVEREDRWKVIAHIRQVQASEAEAGKEPES